MTAVWEPPDYRKLYDEQCLKNQMLQCKNDQLKETLRDQMAMAALTGLFANADVFVNNSSADSLARVAYDQADAMMEARKQ